MQGKIRTIAALCALTVLGSAHAAEADAGAQLRAQVIHSYPSLRDVERYRHDFPDEVQGHAFWSVDHAAFFLPDADALTRALAALQDQHVALVGAKAGRSETLGMLFRTVNDGSVIVWRVFDATAGNAHVAEGDQVLAIDGLDAHAWMQHAASRRGNCWDSACSETLFGSLKVEWLHGQRFVTRRHAKDETLAWLLWYNQSRLHSTLNYVSPMQFENHWLAAQAARFPVQRDLDTFDFTQTTINEAQLRELHRCALLNEARNLVFVGGPGTGKTHLAMALGRAAIRSHGKRV